MQKKEFAELRKRFVKETASFDKLAGCYVDAEKNKICKFNTHFQGLDEESFFKYLDIAKKSLSGTIGNNLLEFEFPNVEEGQYGKQEMLMTLLDPDVNDKAFDDTYLDQYYNNIIENYETMDNYLILIFHDAYDVPVKTKDNVNNGESDEVYNYLIIAICPVTLDKAALCYNKDSRDIEPRERDWIVGAPETAILFPPFTDRAADIHSCVVYNKNPKEPHNEFIENGLGCEVVKTTAMMQDEFYDIIRSNFDDEEQGDKAVLAAVKDMNDILVSNYDKNDKPTELSADDITDMLSENSRFTPKTCKAISEAYNKTFAENLDTDVIVDQKLLKKNKEKLHVLELEDSLSDLHKKMDKSKTNNNKNDNINDIDDTINIIVPDNMSIEMQDVDGKQCIVIPVDSIDLDKLFVNNKKIGDI